MSTALQLANRIRRMLREEDLSSFTTADGSGQAILDRLNDAMLTVLNDRVWDFMIRHDGIMMFDRAIIPNPNITSVTTGSSNFVVGAGVDLPRAPLIGRIAFTSDSGFGNTALRLVAQAPILATATLDDFWPGATAAAPTLVANTYSWEYILPATVRSILSARHEQQELRLEFVDKNIDFDSIFPRPWDHTDDSPELLIIGGTGLGTAFNTTPPASSPSTIYGTIARVYPVPSADLRVEYSYVLEPLVFSATTDEYTYIPEKVNDLIVDLAYARCQQVGIGNEPQMGIALEARVQANLRNTWGAHRPAAGQRRILRSLDAKGGRNPLYAGLPRVVGSL